MADNQADDASIHEGTEEAQQSAETLDNDALMLRFKDWWRHDLPRCKVWHHEAFQDFKFRAGDQWQEEDQQVMEDLQKRACLTFNQIDPVIDAVAGSEITNRQEVRYIPRQVGSAPVNEVLTEAARWFRDECDAEHEESNAFADAITTGMGWTETRLDYEENQDGDPKVERVDPLEMVWDGAAKKANLLDARRVFRVKHDMPLLEAQQRWPKDAEGNVIIDDSDYDATWATDLDEVGEEVPYKVHFPGEKLEHEAGEAREEEVVTVVQIQWYERQDFFRSVLLDPQTGAQQTAELSPEEHMTAMTRADELGHAYRGVKQSRRVYYKAHVGGRVLELTKMIGPSKTLATSFTLLAMTGKWDRNNAIFYGLVRSMRGPQTFANKWLSTAVEMMARGAKGGLMLEEGAVVDPERFEDEWATPGSNSYFKPGAITGGKVQPKPATQFPQDWMGMTQFAVSSIRDVTGVNVERLGLASGTPTGGPDTASQEYSRNQSATVILAPLFDSLRRYRRAQGRHLLWLITEFLSDGRLVRIVGEEGDRFIPLIHDQNTLKYDVIVDDAPSSPSQKDVVWRSFVTMMPLVQAMNPPPSMMMVMLEYSPMPASVVAKLKAAWQEFQQQQQQNPQPNPMQMIMMEKQQDIEAEKAKQQLRLQAKQQENQLDLMHMQAKAKIDVQSRIALARVAAMAKQHEAQTQAAAAPPAVHPMDAAVQEGLAQGVKAGVTQVATQVAAGQFGQHQPVTGEPGGAVKPQQADSGNSGQNNDMLDIIRHLSGAPPKVTKPEKPPVDHMPAILDLTKNVHDLTKHLSKRKNPVGLKRTADGMRVVYDGEP